MGAAARAQPDGLTMMLAASNFVVNPGLYKKIPYDPIKDFIPITIVGDSPNAIVVHPSVPAKNIKELIDLIKKKPGEYTYASGGTGALPQLSCELFRMHVRSQPPSCAAPQRGPGRSIGPGWAHPVGGVGLASVLELINTGQLRGLGVTGKERFPSVPNIPTMKEQGVPNLEECNWQGFMVPAGTPQPAVDYLYREIVKAVNAPGMRERLIELGFNPLDVPPDPVQGADRCRSGQVAQGDQGRQDRNHLEHDPEKACPGLDPGRAPVFGKDHAQAIWSGMTTRRSHHAPAEVDETSSASESRLGVAAGQATPARRRSCRCTMPTGLPPSTTNSAVIFDELRISSTSLASWSGRTVIGRLVITIVDFGARAGSGPCDGADRRR